MRRPLNPERLHCQHLPASNVLGELCPPNLGMLPSEHRCCSWTSLSCTFENNQGERWCGLRAGLG